MKKISKKMLSTSLFFGNVVKCMVLLLTLTRFLSKALILFFLLVVLWSDRESRIQNIIHKTCITSNLIYKVEITHIGQKYLTKNFLSENNHFRKNRCNIFSVSKPYYWESYIYIYIYIYGPLLRWFGILTETNILQLHQSSFGKME